MTSENLTLKLPTLPLPVKRCMAIATLFALGLTFADGTLTWGQIFGVLCLANSVGLGIGFICEACKDE